MSRLPKSVLPVFVVATLAGACLHFVYELFPNPLTACFSPVCESLWEHLKLLYWPYLLASLFLVRREGWQSLGRRAFAVLVPSAVMLAVGYVYHILLGGESLFFDIALYVLLMAVAFFLPAFLRRSCWDAWREPLLLLAVALGAAIVLFTFLPPMGLLFIDLSGVKTWVVLPC